MYSNEDMDASDRFFYEQSRFKVVVSIFLAGLGLISLAFCSAYAGQSDSARLTAEQVSSNNKVEQAYSSLASGYGE